MKKDERNTQAKIKGKVDRGQAKIWKDFIRTLVLDGVDEWDHCTKQQREFDWGMWQRQSETDLKEREGRIKREEGEGGTELQALGGGREDLTSSQSHTRTHTHTSLSALKFWEHPRNALIPETLLKSLKSRPKDTHPRTCLFPDWPRTNPLSTCSPLGV